MTTGRINQIAFVAGGSGEPSKTEARSATRLAVIRSFSFAMQTQPGQQSPAGMYHTQSRRRLPRPDEESPDSVTSRNATDSRAPGSLSPTGCCADAAAGSARKNTLSAKQPKSCLKGAGGDLAPDLLEETLPPEIGATAEISSPTRLRLATDCATEENHRRRLALPPMVR